MTQILSRHNLKNKCKRNNPRGPISYSTSRKPKYCAIHSFTQEWWDASPQHVASGIPICWDIPGVTERNEEPTACWWSLILNFFCLKELSFTVFSLVIYIKEYSRLLWVTLFPFGISCSWPYSNTSYSPWSCLSGIVTPAQLKSTWSSSPKLQHGSVLRFQKSGILVVSGNNARGQLCFQNIAI